MRRSGPASSVDFDQPWEKYVEGFGDPGGDHWLGLRYASKQLGKEKHTLRVDLKTSKGIEAHAVFYGFILFETSTGDGYTIRYDTIAPGSNAGERIVILRRVQHRPLSSLVLESGRVGSAGC